MLTGNHGLGSWADTEIPASQAKLTSSRSDHVSTIGGNLIVGFPVVVRPQLEDEPILDHP